MGFNTAVIILNDHLHSIESDPNFGKKLSDGILETYNRPREKHYHSEFDCLPSQHADWDQLVVIGQNSIRNFKDLTKEEAKAVLKNAAWEAGFKLSFKEIK